MATKNRFVVCPRKQRFVLLIDSFLGDTLLEGGIYKSLASGIEYEEKRLFLANLFLVKFFFLTRYERSCIDADDFIAQVLAVGTIWSREYLKNFVKIRRNQI